MYIDDKYIGLISNRLALFKRKGPTYNFRCPLCGDSQTNKNKTRGYLIRKSDKMLFYCHNCNASMAFGKFLSIVDSELSKQYVQECFIERNAGKERTVVTSTPLSTSITFKNSPLNGLKKVSQLEPFHPAKRYIMKRKIPTTFHHKLFYVSKFKKWVNSIIPDKFNPENDEPRLLIPLVDSEQNCFGVQGRSFKSDGIRYITIIFDERKPKLYGLDSVDFTKKTYVTEGPIDSMFLPNAIAMVGSNGIGVVEEVAGEHKNNLVFVYDNEPRNKDICALMDKVIEKGYNIVIWPEHILNKDINEMILLGGIPAHNLQLIMDANTFSGIRASLVMSKWRK